MRFSSIVVPLKNRYMLLRHGETDANKQKIYMGRLNYGLNEVGQNQALQVKLPFLPDIIISSPLKRTQETAIALGLPRIEIIEDSRLIEKSGGSIEGKTYEEIARNHPESWNIWETKPLEYIVEARFPYGESDAEVIKRVDSFFTETEKFHHGKTILVVTHSGVIQATRYLLGKDKEAIYLTPIPSCYIEVL